LGIDQEYEQALEQHYEKVWGKHHARYVWDRGRALPQECRVFEFGPSELGPVWIYATCGMSLREETSSLELFLLSPSKSQDHVELLTAIADFHQTGAKLDLGHTVNFGRPWLDESKCSFGLISLPYPFGPDLEKADIAGGSIRVLWLIPITPDERAFKIKFGLETLEQLFEEKEFNCLDPLRDSVVATA
jgi:Suppressor of fused protein (SUFU)